MSCLSGPLSDDLSNLRNERAWNEYRQARDVEHVQSFSARVLVSASVLPGAYCCGVAVWPQVARVNKVRATNADAAPAYYV